MTSIVQVAIPCPLRQLFDYLSNKTSSFWQPGMRVEVSFGHRKVIGIVLAARQAHPEQDLQKLKNIDRDIDEFGLIPAELISLIQWASHYYHHPIGECFQTALPKKLRLGEPAAIIQENWWSLKENASATRVGKKQQTLLNYLRDFPEGLSQSALRQYLGNCTASLLGLQQKELVSLRLEPKQPAAETVRLTPCDLNQQQQQAVDTVIKKQQKFSPVLLHGVTGSGKTEVYIELARQMLLLQKQVLILIPEIGLTGQFVSRFRQQLDARIVIIHSSIAASERKQAWLLAREGFADIIIGTRSAVFTPLKNPGLLIIDEEHDGSYKQQEGLRYHARNVALIRARQLEIPIVLGSATPSLEALYQVEQQRYQLLQLTERAGGARLPKVKLIDSNHADNSHGITQTLLNQIAAHTAEGNQVLLFINRRGFAPVLMCHQCHWQATCEHCDARMVVHQQRHILFCHHCGRIKRLLDKCANCQSEDLKTCGAGTEKIEKVLQGYFPTIPVLRIDRDTTQRKQAFADLVTELKQGQARILVGTQMLAKGHDFHNVTLVGVLDADQGLYSADFRATETLAQLITQVTGRAGRGEKAGEVLIQTDQPHHPFWQQLLEKGYNDAAIAMLKQRKEMMMPPVGAWAVIRAEAQDAALSAQFLSDAVAIFEQTRQQDVLLMGPVPAVMERKAGRYRAQLLLTTQKRRALHQLIDQHIDAIASLKLARKVRWSIDIDPTDLL